MKVRTLKWGDYSGLLGWGGTISVSLKSDVSWLTSQSKDDMKNSQRGATLLALKKEEVGHKPRNTFSL